MKYLAKLKDLEFVVPVALVAIAAVYLYNTFVAAKLSQAAGRDLSA